MTTAPTSQPESQLPDTSPQITIPEGQEGMAAPGQENIVEAYIKEQEAAQQEANIPEKFRNASKEDLIKAYQELEKMKSKPEETQETKAEQESPETSEIKAPDKREDYTIELANQLYGAEAVAKLEEKGIDMREIMWKGDQGEDISEHYDALAESFGVTKPMVAMFMQNVSRLQARQEGTPEISEADEIDLMNEAGGKEQFEQLAGWAKSNLSEDLIKDFDGLIDTGNKEAVKWAIRALRAERNSPDSVIEPKLYGGGDAPAESTFRSQQQVLDAMNKKNERGQKLYEVDSAYREKFEQLLRNSPDTLFPS